MPYKSFFHAYYTIFFLKIVPSPDIGTNIIPIVDNC